MNKVKRSGALHSMAMLALTACVAAPAMAYDQRGDSIFSRIEPSLRERAFMRLSYIHANVKTTSGDAYDVTGPVVAPGDIVNRLGNGSGYTSMFVRGNLAGVPDSSGARVDPGFYNTAGSLLDTFMTQDEPDPLGNPDFVGDSVSCPQLKQGLGTPCGIRAKSSASLGTPALSVGYYLDQEMNWLLEAFLLAAPLKAQVYGDGNNGLNGQRIIDLKLLPPTAILGRYFGEANARIRPFAGLGASYAIFFDVRATQALNTYQGGPTTISVKNALGFGPFFGVKAQLDDDWHFSLNIGKLRYKTEATLVTRDTVITADSQVINDYGPGVQLANTIGIQSGNGRPVAVAPADGSVPKVAGYNVGDTIAPLTALMCDLARAKYGNNQCNQGTFVRKQKTNLDNTLFMLSVGRRF